MAASPRDPRKAIENLVTALLDEEPRTPHREPEKSGPRTARRLPDALRDRLRPPTGERPRGGLEAVLALVSDLVADLGTGSNGLPGGAAGRRSGGARRDADAVEAEIRAAAARLDLPKDVAAALDRAAPRLACALTRVSVEITPGAIGSLVFEPPAFPEIVGESPEMQSLCDTIAKIAGSNLSVLIVGESGTGKELVARAIHQGSKRRSGEFVAINCGAIPEQLIESELFGHVRGAFTGATADKKGYFHLASGGTIFLDEIASMPHLLQVKLLRALQERAARPVGGAKLLPFDVRVISATNKDLESLCEEALFRSDLFFRLNELEIRIPPLRARRADVPLLATHFAARFAAENERCPAAISREAMRRLSDYDWPGNVRELENAVKRAVVLAEGSVEVRHLPSFLQTGKPGRRGLFSDAPPVDRPREVCEHDPAPVSEAAAGSLAERMGAHERRLIAEALRFHKGNVTRTARALGITRRTLERKMIVHALRQGAEGAGTT